MPKIEHQSAMEILDSRGRLTVKAACGFAEGQRATASVPSVASTGAALPRLTINLFSGGKHAGGQVPIQDVLIVPRAATIDEGLAQAYAVYASAAKLIERKYGMRLLRADEGGLAPPAASVEVLFDDAVQSIRDAGFEPGRDVALALDVASSHFCSDGRYHLAGVPLASDAMIRTIAQWV